jgi:hypothetical protein
MATDEAVQAAMTTALSRGAATRLDGLSDHSDVAVE